MDQESETTTSKESSIPVVESASVPIKPASDPLGFAGFINSKPVLPEWGQSISIAMDLVKEKSPLAIVWLIVMAVFVVFAITGLGAMLSFVGSIGLFIFFSWLTGTTAGYLLAAKSEWVGKGVSEKLKYLGTVPKSYKGWGRYIGAVGLLSAVWLVGAVVPVLLGSLIGSDIARLLQVVAVVWTLIVGSSSMFVAMIAGPLIALHSQGALDSVKLGVRVLVEQPKKMVPLALSWVVFCLLCSSSVLSGAGGFFALLLALILPPVGLMLMVHTVGYYKAIYLQPQSWIRSRLMKKGQVKVIVKKVISK